MIKLYKQEIIWIVSYWLIKKTVNPGAGAGKSGWCNGDIYCVPLLLTRAGIERSSSSRLQCIPYPEGEIL